MSEEIINQELNNTPDPIVDPEIDKARAGGWKPLEEWEGNPEEWIDAKTFNKNGEYIDHIKNLSSDYKKAQKKISKLEKDFSILAEHHSKVAQLEREKAMKELKDLKKEALANLDADKVIEIDDKIEELREVHNKETKIESRQANDSKDVVSQWTKDNPWYDADKVLRAAANGLIQELIAEDPDRRNDVEGVLEEVTQQLKVEFPNKFGTARTRSTSTITEPGDTSGKKQTTSYAKRLSPELRQVAQSFVNQGVFTSVEDYAKELHELGEL